MRLVAQVVEQKETTVFQRLREWYLDASHKRGDHRRELEVSSCFAPLLRWIVQRWASEDRRLALALDASTDSGIAGQCFRSVCWCAAVPLRWRGRVIGAHAKGSWRPYWEALLERLKGSVPADWQGTRARRSRAVCQVALHSHCSLWLASIPAD